MEWEEIASDAALQNLPYKIELNRWGQIVMSPASIPHVLFQNAIVDLLKGMLKDGKALQEFPIRTKENVKAPDVVWVSDGLLETIKDQVASPVAPEICIEVMSPGNTREQMRTKMGLYFEAGAEEAWICGGDGRVEFYAPSGQMPHSLRAPAFPDKVHI